MPTFHTLDLSSVYMHQVAIVGSGDEREFAATLTDVEVELTEADLNFLRERFVDALERRALRILPSEDVDSPTPTLVQDHLEDPNMLSLSQSLAIRLAAVQRLNAKPGLLVVADAELDGTKCVLIAKVEHQEAMRAEPTVLKDGLRGISLEHINDLVFGELNRVYKIAILRQTDLDASTEDAAQEFEGYLADIQNGRNFANYYLGEFLGFRLADEPEVLTERFLETFSVVIESSSLNANEKIDAHAALSLELKSNTQTLDAADFIRKHIPAAHQQVIQRGAKERGLPLMSFTKDPRRVKNKLDNLRIRLGGDISIDAPADQIGEAGKVRVQRNDTENGEELYDVTIKGVPLDSVSNSNSR
ncbi:hypothetical protein GCM10025784_17270 [Citricoccus nitrophenolicus]